MIKNYQLECHPSHLINRDFFYHSTHRVKSLDDGDLKSRNQLKKYTKQFYIKTNYLNADRFEKS